MNTYSIIRKLGRNPVKNLLDLLANDLEIFLEQLEDDTTLEIMTQPLDSSDTRSIAMKKNLFTCIWQRINALVSVCEETDFSADLFEPIINSAITKKDFIFDATPHWDVDTKKIFYMLYHAAKITSLNSTPSQIKESIREIIPYYRANANFKSFLQSKLPYVAAHIEHNPTHLRSHVRNFLMSPTVTRVNSPSEELFNSCEGRSLSPL